MLQLKDMRLIFGAAPQSTAYKTNRGSWENLIA
jgi:hypothetical protein